MPKSDTTAGKGGHLSPLGRSFLVAVISSGAATLGVSAYQIFSHPLPHQWYLLAALTLISGSATVTLPTVGASISVSETFVFASVLLFGPSAGTITVALDGLVISLWMSKRRPEWYRALFNMAAPAASIWIASQLLFRVAHIQPLFGLQSSVNALVLPLLAFAALYFMLNSWLIVLAVALEKRLSAYELWRQNFLWLSLNYFCGASVALLLVVYTREVDLGFIAVIVPLLLVLYYTYKTTMARVEDANAHLKQVNRLYFSTIEALAMAIDAKDQVTHGHIRRVQQFAVGLARAMGIGDETLIKAIEAAALLHDMGKLVVPEYILNKPGKLTDAEFTKMKQHAAVGADILSSIDFPYPVVPIVRHHHEHWDGTGYPDRIDGTSIPLGARILSVVDCFDALTSDRPYRPRMTDDDAIRIIRERRGVMYDPLVVDTFIRVYQDIRPEPSSHADQNIVLSEIKSSSLIGIASTGSTSVDSRTPGAAPDEAESLVQHIRPLISMELVACVTSYVLRHLPEGSIVVLFLYDAGCDDLFVAHAAGDASPTIGEVRIPLGERLSGWVAVNRQNILNADAALDLGDLARSHIPPLRSCVSTSIIAGSELVGVLNGYSREPNGFVDTHRLILEAVGNATAQVLRVLGDDAKGNGSLFACRETLPSVPHPIPSPQDLISSPS
jgi:putative nucleotidyltransferase with HDIG domain